MTSFFIELQFLTAVSSGTLRTSWRLKNVLNWRCILALVTWWLNIAGRPTEGIPITSELGTHARFKCVSEDRLWLLFGGEWPSSRPAVLLSASSILVAFVCLSRIILGATIAQAHSLPTLCVFILLLHLLAYSLSYWQHRHIKHKQESYANAYILLQNVKL